MKGQNTYYSMRLMDLLTMSHSVVFIRSVEFETRDDMLDCIRKADNTELGGKKIRLTEVSTCICSQKSLLYSLVGTVPYFSSSNMLVYLTWFCWFVLGKLFQPLFCSCSTLCWWSGFNLNKSLFVIMYHALRYKMMILEFCSVPLNKLIFLQDKGHHSSPPRRSYKRSSRSRSRSRSPRSRSRSPRSRSRSRSPRRRSK